MMLLGLAVVVCIALLAAGLVLFTLYTAHRVERALPPRGRFLDVGDTRLHYLDEGQGPAILMIHGLGGQMAHFTYALLDQLKQDFRVVLFDRPGSGYSQRPRGASAQLRAQGEVIAKGIEALKLDKPLLVGHSMGGAVVLAIALDHPELVRGAALIAPLTHPVADPPAAFEALAIKSDARRRLISWTLATPMSILRQHQLLAAVFDPDPAPPDFGVRAGGLLGLRPRAFRAASLDMVSANKDLWDMVTRYPGLTIPVGILFGRDDRILDPHAHGWAMKDAAPAVEMEMTDGGHMLPIIAPERCAAFIRQVEARIAERKPNIIRPGAA